MSVTGKIIGHLQQWTGQEKLRAQPVRHFVLLTVLSLGWEAVVFF